MSFGAAAQRGRVLAPDAPCPCGEAPFGVCCGPILAGRAAETAVQLMRSRFTAFALGDAAHLRATWHPSSAPEMLELDSGWSWRRLEIVRAQGGARGERRGVVEFRAHWRDLRTGESGILHETSRFRAVGARWYYLDGDVSDGASAPLVG